MFAFAEALLSRAGIRLAVRWLARRLGAGLPFPPPDVGSGDIEPDGAPADDVDPITWRVEPGSRTPSATDSAGPATPITGWTFVLKDNFDVAGAPWNEGTCLERPVPDRDAAILTALERAGAVLIGKAQMTELGLSGLGLQPHRGTLDNPAAPGHFAGGSSTGPAVVVAKGDARFAIGSDALGSVRLPAAFTGLYGLKPTRGGVSMDGYRSLAPAIDVPGPIARTLGDLIAVFGVLSGQTLLPARPTGRVLVSKAALPASPDVAQAVMRSARELELVPGPVPDFGRALAVAVMSGGCALADVPIPPRAAPETRLVLGLARCFDQQVADRIAAERVTIADRFLAMLDRSRADALLLPTAAIAAPARTRARMRSRPEPGLHTALGIFTTLANVTGCPAIVVPIGRDARGRPLSSMLVGRPGAEATLFALAASLKEGAGPSSR